LAQAARVTCRLGRRAATDRWFFLTIFFLKVVHFNNSLMQVVSYVKNSRSAGAACSVGRPAARGSRGSGWVPSRPRASGELRQEGRSKLQKPKPPHGHAGVVPEVACTISVDVCFLHAPVRAGPKASVWFFNASSNAACTHIWQIGSCHMYACDEGMTNRSPIFAYLVFGSGKVSLGRLMRPIKAAVWRGLWM
jgi:hypothetical protein